MRIARRRFLAGTVVGGALARGIPAGAEPFASPAPVAPPMAVAATLRAYVDVLIPADETPSGTALGVDRRLLAVARSRRDFQRLLDLGLDWLERQARIDYGRGFLELAEDDRDAVVRVAATAERGTLPKVFFEQTRADAFFHYYGRPESWRGIGRYRGPPQPVGFMDYADKPGPTR